MLIGELAGRCGLSARMLRHYDRIGLVSPTERTSGGYREYSPEDVRRLFHVEGLRSLGLSLQEIADVLADLSFTPAAMVEQLISRTQERLRRDEELLSRLAQVQASEATAWSDVLRTIGLLRGLDAEDPSARLRSALSHAGQAEADTATLAEAALNEADPQVAGALYWVLARAGDRAVPVLADALGSPDPDRRRRAVAALIKIDGPLATAALADAAGHPDPLVSARGTLAAGRTPSRGWSPWWPTGATTSRPPICWAGWPARMTWHRPSPTPSPPHCPAQGRRRGSGWRRRSPRYPAHWPSRPCRTWPQIRIRASR